MKYASISTTGPAADTIGLAECAPPIPGPGEVSIRMAWAPVNPADLNWIEGTYGTQPELPGTPGIEGSGIVLACGEGVTSLRPGQPVISLHGLGTWSQVIVRQAEHVLALPDGTDLQQAAMLRVNPATAWHLLHTRGPLPPGTWVLQNAASSALGHCVISLARHLGLRTVSLVRRPESIPGILAAGGDAAWLDEAASVAPVRELLEKSPAPLALNAVGGESATRLMDWLAPGGTMVTVGAMARQPLKVANRFLIFKGLHLTGFWLTRWMESADAGEIRALYTRLAGLLHDGALHQPVAATYSLTEIKEALMHAATSSRGGKILLHLDPGSDL